VYSQIENVQAIQEIQHPAVRAVLGYADIEAGLEIHHDGDLPARSGLGSSSSFTVGLLHALKALDGKLSDKEALAREAIHVEQNIIKESVGSQDQVSAAFGGFNKIVFNRNDSFDVYPIIVQKERISELNDHLMLFFTGFSRFSSDIAKSKVDNFRNKQDELNYMLAMVDEAISILENLDSPIDQFGKMLHVSWQYKRSLSDKVSTPEIDKLYEVAIGAGATGGKILGAGGGGFLLVFAKPEKQVAVRQSLHQLVHVPFKFENSGSRVVLYQPNGL
jgi:D-glycero-alpha-D-manno-heptose-7-phosphate kinase